MASMNASPSGISTQGITGRGNVAPDDLTCGGAPSTYDARASLSIVPRFRFHFFSHAGETYGRVDSLVTPFVGPGYFHVERTRDEARPLSFDFDFDFDEVGDITPPEGWPPIARGAMSPMGIATRGTQIHVRPAGDGTYAGEVWRHGIDTGISVRFSRS